MGASQSSGLKLPTCRIDNAFAITFVSRNRIRFMSAPVEILNSTKSVLGGYYPDYSVQEVNIAAEFELVGVTPFKPWFSIHSENVKAKEFLCALLKAFYSIGWHLKFSTNLHYQGQLPGVLIFEKENYLDTNLMCISLDSTDLLTVVGPADLFPVIRTEIHLNWRNGIQKEETSDRHCMFKLKGNPWNGILVDGDDSYNKVLLINAVLEALYKKGWVFTSPIKTSPGTLNSLYFRYDQKLLDKDEHRSSKFFAISLNESDKLRLYRASPDLLEKIRSAILQYWTKGIQGEKEIGNCIEFKLKGTPWWAMNSEMVYAEKLISGLFSQLRQSNWNLYAICDLTLALSSKSTFFFRWDPNTSSRFSNILCLNLDEINKLRIINYDEHVKNLVRNTICEIWTPGIKQDLALSDSWEFKLQGEPFNGARSFSQLNVIFMMMLMLNRLKNQGFNFYASADISGIHISDRKLSHNLHSWYFYME